MNEAPTPPQSPPPPPDTGVQLSIGVNEYGRVIISFGKDISWIGLDPIAALEIANVMIANAIGAIKNAHPLAQQAPPQNPASADGLPN